MMSRRTACTSLIALLLAGLSLSAIGLAAASRAYHQRYLGRIYPGVSIYGVNLGGLIVDEAAARLQASFPDPAVLLVTLRDGERTWSRSWADFGIHLDPQATANLAYQVGRVGSLEQQYGTQLQALLAGHPLSPVIVLPDPARAAAALEALAAEVAIPPVNAGLVIGPGSIIPVPAQAGRALDVEATVAVFAHAVGVGKDGLVIELLTRQVAPPIGAAGPAQAQAEALLARPFTLAADDPLTGFSATWTVEPAVVATWLAVQPVEDENGARLALTAQEEAIRAYLSNLGSQLTDEVALDIEKTAPAVRVALEAGEGQATVALTHTPHSYTVQPGDTLGSIARGHGFPVWWVAEANPGVDLGALQPGQQIVIPSIDILFPFPLTTDRRIVIDISDQHLYAYEGDMLVYDYVCSTGIASSPTITGTFEILSKEENAYASSWDLWMPHFMGIYRSGPDFTNGIHGLPTLSSGALLWEGYLGRPVSYGCIVIGLDEAATLYDWAELGTAVVIQE
jgi:lipoprotein-anchoring transpeptidase ErfK/SrfK